MHTKFKSNFRIENFVKKLCAENIFNKISVFGVNNGCDQFDDILSYGWLNEYDIRIKLGHSTTDGSNLSPVKETCDFSKIFLIRCYSFSQALHIAFILLLQILVELSSVLYHFYTLFSS